MRAHRTSRARAAAVLVGTHGVVFMVGAAISTVLLMMAAPHTVRCDREHVPDRYEINLAEGEPEVPIVAVDLEEYCRQVAVTTFIRSYHRIDDREITFFRDPRFPGSAIEQFADRFGRVIQTGMEPGSRRERSFRPPYPRVEFREPEVLDTDGPEMPPPAVGH